MGLAWLQRPSWTNPSLQGTKQPQLLVRGAWCGKRRMAQHIRNPEHRYLIPTRSDKLIQNLNDPATATAARRRSSAYTLAAFLPVLSAAWDQVLLRASKRKSLRTTWCIIPCRLPYTSLAHNRSEHEAFELKFAHALCILWTHWIKHMYMWDCGECSTTSAQIHMLLLTKLIADGTVHGGLAADVLFWRC